MVPISCKLIKMEVLTLKQLARFSMLALAQC